MPLVRIDVVGPKSTPWTDAVLAETRAAVTGALDVGDERVVVRVIETPAAQVSLPACRTERFTQVEVVLYEGRTNETKRAFVEELRARLALNPGIEPSEVTVDLRDCSKTDLDVLPGQAG